MNCLSCFESLFYIIKNNILFVKFSFELVFAAYRNENDDLLEINIIQEKVSESCGHLVYVSQLKGPEG